MYTEEDDDVSQGVDDGVGVGYTTTELLEGSETGYEGGLVEGQGAKAPLESVQSMTTMGVLL